MTPQQPQSPGREAFLAPFIDAGYRAVEPSILQPSNVFLDLSGEELAKRLYLTTDADGRELCLRPELTIPVCLDHVSGGDPARLGAYCYHGPVFRHRPGENGEFVQAGVESIGRTDTARADAEVFALALDCLARAGLSAPRIRAGDTSLFRTVLGGLELPAVWRRRLARDFGRQEKVAADLDSLTASKRDPAYGGVLGALSGADRASARALVEDLLRIGGLSAAGGRSAGEIAERFLEQAELENGARVAPEKLAILAGVLAASGHPERVLETVERVTRPIAAQVAPALEAFAARNAAFAEAGIALDRIGFEGGFGRRLDYYTGLVFEMNDPDRPAVPALVGGGRYDGLLRFLGAAAAVPAVGFSVWVERLPGGVP